MDVMSENTDGLANRGRVAIAWLAILPASSASLILYRVLLSREPSASVAFVNVAILVLLLAFAYAIAAWRPLRGYFLARIASPSLRPMAQGLASAG